MTNSVKDAAIVFDAIKGGDRRDQTSVDYDYGSSLAECLDRDVKGMRIGVAEEFFDGINPEIKSKIEEAIKLFERTVL